LLIRPREAGEGDHAKRGGGGIRFGVEQNVEALRCVAARAPPTACGVPPSPLARGGMQMARRENAMAGDYLTRFQSSSVDPPTETAGLLYFSSLAESVTIGRF
jgi:hypothetical protein